MQQLARAEQQSKEMSALMKKDFESNESEKSQKIKELEKSQRQLKQEKDEMTRVRLAFPFPPFTHSLIQLCPLLYLFYIFIKPSDVIGRVSPLYLYRKWPKCRRSYDCSPKS